MNDLVEMLTQMLGRESNSEISGLKLRTNNSPKELLRKVDIGLSTTGNSNETLNYVIEKVVSNSVNTDHPLFMNQMYGRQQEAGVLGDTLTGLLNTSMYTYEVAPVMTMIEKECIDRLCSFVWKSTDDRNDGVFTPGSSISNMTAMMMARNRMFPEVKKKGLYGSSRFSIFVSDQAHYSFMKGAMFLGFGQDCIVKVKSDPDGRIDIFELNLAIQRAKEDGIIPLMLVGIAGTTFAGKFDPIETLSNIAQTHNMWFHVDGAYGSSLLFSEKESPKFQGIEKADSVSWSLHKIMGVPLVCAVLLTKEYGLLNESFAVDADYIFHDNNDYDLGQKSLQCGRRVDALKLWLAWKKEGDIGFESRVDSLMRISHRFAEMIGENKRYQLLNSPETPIVCFRLINDSLNKTSLNNLNIMIREEIFQAGEILFNYSPDSEGRIWLRCVIGDPKMTEEHLQLILNEVERTGDLILKNNDLSDKETDTNSDCRIPDTIKPTGTIDSKPV